MDEYTTDICTGANGSKDTKPDLRLIAKLWKPEDRDLPMLLVSTQTRLSHHRKFVEGRDAKKFEQRTDLLAIAFLVKSLEALKAPAATRKEATKFLAQATKMAAKTKKKSTATPTKTTTTGSTADLSKLSKEGKREYLALVKASKGDRVQQNEAYELVLELYPVKPAPKTKTRRKSGAKTEPPAAK